MPHIAAAPLRRPWAVDTLRYQAFTTSTPRKIAYVARMRGAMCAWLPLASRSAPRCDKVVPPSGKVAATAGRSRTERSRVII